MRIALVFAVCFPFRRLALLLSSLLLVVGYDVLRLLVGEMWVLPHDLKTIGVGKFNA